MKNASALSSRKSLRVSLGENWRRFSMPQRDLEFLGIAQRGLEIGALARDISSGTYLLVNGDLRQILNSSKVETALRSAGKAMASRAYGPQPVQTRQPVVVIVKPRRRIPTATAE